MSSRMRTGGMTMPSSEAIWRRIVPTRASSVPPACWSTIGTRPKPMASSSGSSASASSAASLGAGSCACSGAAAFAARSAACALHGVRLVAQRPADAEQERADQEERELGQARDEAEDRCTIAPATIGALRWSKIWLDDRRCRGLSLARRAGDEDAGGDGDQQRGDLRAQAVADREQREVVAGLANGMPCCTTPITMPPSRLMPVIRMPAIASPLTNFEAPSIAP